METTLTQEYMNAFSRCYPQTRVEIKVNTDRTGQIRFRVGINGDFGDRTLSEHDLRGAIRDFNRGRVETNWR